MEGKCEMRKRSIASRSSLILIANASLSIFQTRSIANASFHQITKRHTYNNRNSIPKETELKMKQMKLFPNVASSNILDYNECTHIDHAISPTQLLTSPLSSSTQSQVSLLQQVTEHRRIQSVLQEAQENATSNEKRHALLSLTIVRAKACGYGDDLDSFEAAIDNGEVAREKLILQNIGLVNFVIDDYLSSHNPNSSRGKRLKSLSKEDLVQEGCLGLARAIERYNPDIAKERNAKFSTYAFYWIRAAILRCIAEKDELIRIPEHASTAVKRLQKAAQTIGVDLNRIDLNNFNRNSKSNDKHTSEAWKDAYLAKALADEAGLSECMVREAANIKRRRMFNGELSLEDWMQKDSLTTVNDSGEYFTQLRSNNRKETMNNNDSDRAGNVMQINKVLSPFLSLKEMEALRWRYGLFQEQKFQVEKIKAFRDYESEAEEELFGPSSTVSSKFSSSDFKQSQHIQQPRKGGRRGEYMSFAEVGKQMCCSAENGRKLCARALEKLQDAAEDGKLDPAILCPG